MIGKGIPIATSLFLRLIGTVIVAFLALDALALAEEGDKAVTPEMLAGIQSKSLALLRDVIPDSKSDKPLKTMETADGIIRWGNLFSRKETVALVNLAPSEKTGPYDYPPQYLSLCAWQKKLVWRKGNWVFRQFLGNASDLELHHRKDSPTHFLQARCQTGRNDGDHFSWFYDEATKKLVPTGFEDWGPIYIAGNYLCRTRGYERLAHWDTRWIFSYVHGKMGDFLACMHQDDEGRFTVTFRDAKSGKMKSWFFRPNPDDESRASAGIAKAEQDDGYGGENLTELIVVDKSKSLAPEYCFELLTGLSPALLEEESEKQWRDELPKRKPLERLRIKATGNPEIVDRFQWPKKRLKVSP